MTNVAQYDSSSFTAGDSPAILDVQTDLGAQILTCVLIVDGPGDIAISNSNDGGATFGPDFFQKAHEDIDAILSGTRQIKLTHTGVDSSYRVLAQAGSAKIHFTRPSNSAIYSPLQHHHELNAGEIQVASGVGILHHVYNTKAQPLTIWDFDGVGPTDADLICDFALPGLAHGHVPFGFPFVNGLRIDSSGMGYTVHYE